MLKALVVLISGLFLTLIYVGVLSLGAVPGVLWFGFWLRYLRRSTPSWALILVLALSAIAVPLCLLAWQLSREASDVAGLFPAFVGFQLVWCVLSAWISLGICYAQTSRDWTPATELERDSDGSDDQSIQRYVFCLLRCRRSLDFTRYGQQVCGRQVRWPPGLNMSLRRQKTGIWRYRTPRYHWQTHPLSARVRLGGGAQTWAQKLNTHWPA